MRRGLSPIWMAFASLSLTGCASVASAPPEMTAKSVAIVDAATGTFLFEKASHARRYPASLTKMLTAIIVIERVGTHGRVVVGRKPVRVGESSIGLEVGEEIALDDLLYAVLVKSANDAATAAAEHVSGTRDAFARLMNRRAEELGATGSHFSNPHGLFDPDHYTTAHDLALIARRGMQIPQFRRYVGTRSRRIPGRDGQGERLLQNRNRLLGRYPGATGIKTGYIRASGRCVAASAKRGSSEFIAVILDSERLWQDAQAALDWAFANFQTVEVVRRRRTFKYVPVRGGSRSNVLAYAAGTIPLTVRRGEEDSVRLTYRTRPVAAPVRRGERVGDVVVEAPDGTTLRTALVASQSVSQSGPMGADGVTGLEALIGVGLALLVGGMLYAAAAKSARGRRRGLPAELRATDIRWPSCRQRSSDDAAWDED